MRAFTRTWALALLGSWLAVTALQAADPAAAERQYRVSRRLAAEGSAEAATALQRVVELDPQGELADDALVDQALLLGLARWPEQLGRVEPATAASARELLQGVLTGLAGADRAPQARLLNALLLLEPLPGRDASTARLDLLTVAAASRSEWSSMARYAVGWLDELQGSFDRARAAYQRLIVDLPDTQAANRARVGLARLELRAREFGTAARWLQDAAERDREQDTDALPLRELAVRQMLRGRKLGGSWQLPQGPGAGADLRGVRELARLADGSMLIVDTRGGMVLRVGTDGRTVAKWALENIRTATVDGLGRGFVAAGERIYRLLPQTVQPVASQGDFEPIRAMAADATGRIWVVGRKGQRIGLIEPGAEGPALLWQSRDRRVEKLLWDGQRLIAVDGGEGQLVEIRPDGSEAPLGQPGFERPLSAATDPAGYIAVLDGKAQNVMLFGPGGKMIESYSCEQRGLERPLAIALGPDGALDLYDSEQGWVRVP